MKWVPLDKSKKLEFNSPVFIKDTNGPGLGRLVEIKQTEKGLIHTFEVATFSDEDQNFSTSVTHVAIP